MRSMVRSCMPNMRNDFATTFKIVPSDRGEYFIGATNQDISLFESQVNGSLPIDYREFLQTYCPCRSTDLLVFQIQVEGSIEHLVSIDLLYGISPKISNSESVLSNTCLIRQIIDDFPVKMIVIGHDPGSNIITLSLENSQIYYYCQGYQYFVAQDFTSFVETWKFRFE